MHPTKILERYHTAVAEAEKRLSDAMSALKLGRCTKDFPSLSHYQKRRMQEAELAARSQYSTLLNEIVCKRRKVDAGSAASMDEYCVYLHAALWKVDGVRTALKECGEYLQKEANRPPPRRLDEIPKMPELLSEKLHLTRYNSEGILSGKRPTTQRPQLAPSVSSPCLTAGEKTSSLTTPRRTNPNDSFERTALHARDYQTPRNRINFDSDEENTNTEEERFSKYTPLKMPILRSEQKPQNQKEPLRPRHRVLEFPKLLSDV